MWEMFQSARLRRLFLAETLLLVVLSWVCLRLFASPVPSRLGHFAQASFSFLVALSVSVCVQLAMYYLNLYSDRLVGSRTQRLVRILFAHVLGGGILVLCLDFVPQFRPPRSQLLLCLGITSWLLFSIRCHAVEVMHAGSGRRKVLVMGTGPLAFKIGEWVLSHHGAGYDLIGFLSAKKTDSVQMILGRPVFASCDDVAEIVERHAASDVVFADDEPRRQESLMVRLLRVKITGRRVWSALGFAAEVLYCLPIELLTPADVVFDSGFTPTAFTLFLKRLEDMFLSTIAIVLVSPLLLVTAILVRLDSPGPVLYRQERIGLRGRKFTIYKFRSMRVQAPDEPLRLTSHNDDRITCIGRFLRLHRLDELPQFFNVLVGDMSLVGPRPEVERSVNELRETLPFYDQRHAIRPGITSLGQVRFGAATTLDEARERLKYDLYYQKNMSLAFDLSILIDTVKVVLLKTGAR